MKKKKNVFITAFCIGIACLLIAFVITTNIGKTYKSNVTILNQSSASLYQEKLLLGVKGYLASNNIDLEEIEDELSIDADDILEESELNKSCSGSVTIKKSDVGYDYEANTKCDNQDGINITYKVYHGTIDNAIALDNEILISTFTDISNYKKEQLTENVYTESFDYNLLLTLYDENGNVIWSTKLDQKDDNNMHYYIDDVKKIKNNYYIFVYGDNSNDDNAKEYLYKYDEKGNYISKQEIKFHYSDLATDRIEYIGESDGKYYYQASSNTTYLTYNILVLDENGYTINEIPVSYNDFKKYYEEDSEGEISEEEYKEWYSNLKEDWTYYELLDTFVGEDNIVNVFLGKGIVKNNIYTLSVDDFEDDIMYLYKADLNGKLIKKVQVVNKQGFNSSSNALFVSDNYIYVTYFEDDGSGGTKEGTHDIIDKYDTNLNLVEHDINYLKMLGKDNVEFSNMNISHNKLIIELTEKDDYNITYKLIINPDTNKLEKVYQTSGESYENYGYVNSNMSFLGNRLFEINDAWTSFYEKNIETNEILLAFYE